MGCAHAAVAASWAQRSVSGVAVAALVVGSVGALRAVDTGADRQPMPGDDPWVGYEVFERTATIENFTITSPSDWYLVNQWPLGASLATTSSESNSGSCEMSIGPGEESPGDMVCVDGTSSPAPVDTTPLVPILLLSSNDLGLGTSPCAIGGLQPKGDDAVLEVAIDAAAIDAREAGVASTSPAWPVRFDESATEQGICGQGHYARFEVGIYPYVAFAAFGPDATEEDRRTLFDAFATMQVSEWTGTAPSSRTPGYVIAGGENAAGPWRLELRPSDGSDPDSNIALIAVQAEGGEVGLGDVVLTDIEPIEQAGGDPTFGAVKKTATGVELRLEPGTPPINASIVPLPPSIPFGFDLFFASNPTDVPATAIAVDADGTAIHPTEPTVEPPVVTTFLDDVLHLPEVERWAPRVTRDGDQVVMPVTFPDGASAELVYPSELALEELSVYPDTYGLLDGQSSSCGWPVHASRFDPRGGWVRGDGPLDRFESTTGQVVELWEGTRSSQPYNFLLSRAGSWNVIVPCQSVTTIAGDTASWAELITARESKDGLLVFPDVPPLDMHLRGEGATIRISGDDVVVDVSSGKARCDAGEPDLGWRDGVVQWCLEQSGGVYVYANAFEAARESFLEELVSGLEIRNYRPGND